MRITEGKATIETQGAFYNPKARLARDMGILAARALARERGHPVRVADLFAGTGIRTARYATEAGAVSLLVNEGNGNLVPVIEENLRRNGVEARVVSMEVIALLAELKAKGEHYDLLDADAFGSPGPYLDSVFGAVKFGGLVYITSTDTRTACGYHPRASLRNYGTYLPRCDFCHELGARAVIAVLVLSGGRKGFSVKPLMTLWDGLGLRILVRARWGRASFPAEGLGHILLGEQGPSLVGPGQEFETMGPSRIVGPVWTGPLEDEGFLGAMLREAGNEYPGAARTLEELLQEGNAPPWFFRTDRAAGALGIETPAIEEVIKLLRKKGHQASRTHFSPLGVRTTAPYGEFLGALREAG